MLPILKKFFFLLIAFIFLRSEAVAQPGIPHLEWAKNYGGSDIDQALSIEPTADKGFIVAGLSYSNDGDIVGHHGTTDYSDCWIIKLDSNANLQWQRSLGGDSNDIAYSIKQTFDGGFIVAGYSNSINGDVSGNRKFSGDDFWVVRLNDNGSILWQNTFGGFADDVATDIEETADSRFIVAGYSYSNDGDIANHRGTTATADFLIVKLDKSGLLEWRRTFGGTGDDFAYSIKQTSDHGFVIAGSTNSSDVDVIKNNGSEDCWIVKIDGNGGLIWQKSYGGMNDDVAYNINLTSDNGFIVAGYSASSDGDATSNHGSVDYWIIKLDGSGNLQWQRSFGGSGADAAHSIKQTLDHGFIVTGNAASNDGDVTGNHGGDDYWVVKLDSLGNLQWQKSLGGSEEDFGLSIIQTADSGFVVAGSSDSDDGDITNNQGHEDFWIVKLSNKPANSVEAVENLSLQITNFPNPFADKTQFQFSKQIESPSDLLIFNLLGEQINEVKIPAGSEKNITFIRGMLNAGVYIYHLVSGGEVIAEGRLIVE